MWFYGRLATFIAIILDIFVQMCWIEVKCHVIVVPIRDNFCGSHYFLMYISRGAY